MKGKYVVMLIILIVAVVACFALFLMNYFINKYTGGELETIINMIGIGNAFRGL